MQIYNMLVDTGELDNTYVIYTADHGYHIGQSDWSRGNPCPTSLTSEFPFTSAAQMWRQEACKCVSNDAIQETSQRQPSKKLSGFSGSTMINRYLYYLYKYKFFI